MQVIYAYSGGSLQHAGWSCNLSDRRLSPLVSPLCMCLRVVHPRYNYEGTGFADAVGGARTALKHIFFLKSAISRIGFVSVAKDKP